MLITISKPDKSLKGQIQLEGSKSISNRILIIDALCKDKFNIKNLSPSDDTVSLQKALISKEDFIDVGAAGTSMRFLTAFLSTQDGEWELTGSDRMKERPISILVEALKKLGAQIDYLDKEGYPPLKITGKQINGGHLDIDANVSSQYISALLLIAPYLKDGLALTLKGELVSKPYIKMTLDLMSFFNVECSWDHNLISISSKNYQAKPFSVEADWSAASYYYSMAAIAESAEIKLDGLFKPSLQGDQVIVDIMAKLGVRTQFMDTGILLSKTGNQVDFFEYDFVDCPDLAQTVIVTCAALGIPGKFHGLQTLKIKETDRIKAMSAELSKLGVSFDENLELSGKVSSSSAVISTYKDHRMAMAFAPLALTDAGISIEDENVVGKSYPSFWNDLEKLGFKLD